MRSAPATSTEEAVISVRNVSKLYRLYDRPQDRLQHSLFARFGKRFGREFCALRDVSFDVRRGEVVGIIGRNGSGKSTLLQIIAGIREPTTGDVQVGSRVAALLELGSGFNPDYTGRENVFMNGAILGIPREKITQQFDAIESFADIGEFIDQPVKFYSSGMFVRLAFAVTTSLDAEVLLIDEALAVGDMSFQIKCFARMNQLREQGTTILFVSHNLGTVISFCDRALYLRQGEQVAIGPVAEVARQYEQDCLAEKMAPRRSMTPAGGDVLTERAPATAPSMTEAERLASAARDYRHSFLACAAEGAREGSQTATIESFMLARTNGTPVESISPLEEVTGCFLIRFNADFEGCIHLSIQILDKCGSPLAVIRDSHFDETVQGKARTTFQGVMRFVLPFRAGIYYCRIAVLLFPAGEKYDGGQFNFEQAEIADLVEHGAHFTVLPFVHHPIPAPMLHESKLTLTRLKEYEA